MKFWYKFFCFIFCCPMLFAMTNDEYASWWTSYRGQESIPQDLRVMVDHYVDAGLLRYSSNYWNHLNRYNIMQITLYGYENFKKTVARNYFTWVTDLNAGYPQSVLELVPRPTIALPLEEMKKVHAFFSVEESHRFNLVTERFLNYMVQSGYGDYLQKLEEPLIGSPPSLTYQGRRISQDIFNSLLEYIPISQYCPSLSSVIEIGAGSGRTAYAFLTLQPQVKYIIADFPPALYLSQTYLSEVFPQKKVFKFRPFNTFEEIADEFAAADMVFLMPDQLEKLPSNCTDLFLAIDCLHEMKPDVVTHYFKEAGRLSRHMYFKCWQETTVPFDGVHYSMGSYPVPSEWKMLFQTPCSIPKDFFHALYQIR